MAWIFGGRRQSDGQRNQPNPPVAVNNTANYRPPPPPYRPPVAQPQPPAIQAAHAHVAVNQPDAARAANAMNRPGGTTRRLKYPALDRIEIVPAASSSQRRQELQVLVEQLKVIDADVLVLSSAAPKLDLRIESSILSEAEESVINRSRDLDAERERQQKLVKEHLRRVEEQRREEQHKEEQRREQAKREQEQLERDNIQPTFPVKESLSDREEDQVPIFDFTIAAGPQATLPADSVALQTSHASQAAEGVRGGGTPPPPPPPPLVPPEGSPAMKAMFIQELTDRGHAVKDVELVLEMLGGDVEKAQKALEEMNKLRHEGWERDRSEWAAWLLNKFL
ncbi:hypothetical protein GUITHDRAFT_147001 [Guillardia theta CCMP2712]|uniref:UBA domain-containing protein n=1 Tax=Guillardia theta (strain CCMP2712) TaxID=905079 RepID=L1IEH5_GUITC|nr:hypothetical protein GUITHDRAFT_147001 [Guillardia theta CCMP2712]EKX34676.1 hypothetical protein GUITHDRAFT_147001 [Guillardia theta CCMP2712]|eukprot:XP_005821656.1 hypothetical protein GUITHDRAFT_147001 [Guillardia theta CCMP2712]